MKYVTLTQMIANVEAGAETLKLRAKSPKALEMIELVISHLKAMTVAEHHASIYAEGECAIDTAAAGEHYLISEINRRLIDEKKGA